MSIFSDNIAFLRKQKGLSQEALAEELNSTRSAIGGYEEDRNEPSMDLLIRMSDYFDVSLDNLIRKKLHGKRKIRK